MYPSFHPTDDDHPQGWFTALGMMKRGFNFAFYLLRCLLSSSKNSHISNEANFIEKCMRRLIFVHIDGRHVYIGAAFLPKITAALSVTAACEIKQPPDDEIRF